MKVLVIGGGGFLGSYVADELTLRGHKVKIFDKSKSKWIQKKQQMILGNIQNLKTLEKAIKNSDIVYNFAAVADIGEAMKNPIQTVKTNILGTINILELCKKYNVKKFIFASTIYVHSSQGGFYRTSKQAAELYIEEYGRRSNLNYTILRYGSVYGPRASMKNGLSKIIFNALKSKKIGYSGTSKAVRRFIHAKDAAVASVDILKKKYNNQNILITGKKLSKVKDILYLVGKILNISKKPKFDNETEKGHYDTTPYSYKPKKDKKYFLKNYIDLKKGLFQLSAIIKKK